MLTIAELRDILRSHIEVHTLRDLFLELPLDLQCHLYLTQIAPIRRQREVPWWVFPDGHLSIRWDIFSFDNADCTLCELLAASAFISEVSFMGGDRRAYDWGFILRICCLIPPAKLRLNEYIGDHLQQFLADASPQ